MPPLYLLALFSGGAQVHVHQAHGTEGAEVLHSGTALRVCALARLAGSGVVRLVCSCSSPVTLC